MELYDWLILWMNNRCITMNMSQYLPALVLFLSTEEKGVFLVKTYKSCFSYFKYN